LPLPARRLARGAIRGGRRLWQRLILARLQATLSHARAQRRAMLAGASKRPITLFLAPEAGLEPFYASHVILARVLQDAGEPVVILSCNGLQPTCSLKIAMHVAPTRPGDGTNAACVRCRSKALRIGADYGLPDVTLEELVDTARRAEIDKVITENYATPWNATYDGIMIGQGCLGETLRAARKVETSELAPQDIELGRALLYSALSIYIAVKELGTQHRIGRIAYFGDYAYFIAPQVYAARHCIPLTNVCHAYHRDTDRRYLNLWPSHAIVHQHEQVRRWERYQSNVIDPKTVADIADGALYRLSGHGGVSTYSPNWSENPGDLLTQLGLPPGGKLLVAYTNSTDELVSYRHSLHTLGEEFDNARNPFPTQIDWLTQLIGWAGARSDLRLVLRLHPRMAISARHANLASEYGLMKEAFAALPPNVAVVWPESPISSYNLAENAAVALTAWSSIGLELARFGIPVIAAFQKIGPFPTSDFIGFEESAQAYFAAIERALVRVPNLDTIVGAFRWTHFLHWTPLIDIADVVPRADYDDVPPFRTPKNTPTILKVMADGEDIVAFNMARLPTGPTAAEAERRAVITAIEKFVLYFMSGRLDDRDNLRIGHGAPGAGPQVSIDGDIVELTDGARGARRRSLAAARLIRILDKARVPPNC
jgi:hypothetical protein